MLAVQLFILYNCRMNGGIVGMVHYRLPVQRTPGWKWRLSPREFLPQVFPNFVSGWAYLTSKKAVKRILAAATQGTPALFTGLHS